MFALERRQKIQEIIKKAGRITVEELSERLNVSVVTIRRDLDFLEKANLIDRTFGGAVKKTRLETEKTYHEKEHVQHEEKKAIAKSAIKYVEDGMTILLDAGTTTRQLCEYLKTKKMLTIITFDLQIALDMCSGEDIQIIFIGGEISNRSKSSTGVDALFQLEQYHADLAFIGCDAFDLLQGVFTTSTNRLHLKKKMMEISEKCILLSDSTKYETKAMAKFAILDEFDQVIFDDKNEKLNATLRQTELPYELV